MIETGRYYEHAIRKMERKILTEVLKIYKDNPLLWDSRHKSYNNKQARDQVFEIMLEKYRQFNENFTLKEMKKKIDNMRTSFRKEHRKVVESELRGDEPEFRYRPNLWYYNHFTFLNEDSKYKPFDSQESQIEETLDDAFETPSKRYKTDATASVNKIKLEDESSEESIVFEIENNSTFENISAFEGNSAREKISPYMPNQDVATKTHNVYKEHNKGDPSSKNQDEVQAFAAVVAMQLRDVDSIQRCIAEKLISDVVFLARMNELTINSVVLKNSE